MTTNNDISQVISDIINKRGVEIIKEPKVLCSMLDDLAPQAFFEKKVLRSVLTSNRDVCERLYEIYGSKNMIEVNKLVFIMNKNLGITNEWINVILSAFSFTINLPDKVEENKSSVSTEESVSSKNIVEYNKWLHKKISAGAFHTLAVCENGKVLATGDNRAGQCNVSTWTDIVAVSAGTFHSVGLKSDGTVIATGLNSSGECSVELWKDIKEISANGALTMGLTSQGNVLCTGINRCNQCSTNDWKSIKAISSGKLHASGICSDGTVITTNYIGAGYRGQCDVSNFSGIIQLAANPYHTVGLRNDGTVISTKYIGEQKFNYGQYKVDNWKDIVAVSASGAFTVGLKKDGTLVAIGDNHYGQCNVKGWRLFSNIDNYVSLCKNQIIRQNITNENKASYIEQKETVAEGTGKEKLSAISNIDGPITYDWKFGWSVEGMTNPKPIVNRLLKAIIEGDIQEMENLYRHGATIKKVDEDTFCRILYHIVDKYDVIHWLLQHGMTSKNTAACIDQDGYLWGLLARAWYIKAYNVMELLAYYGFDKMSFCIKGESWYMDELIFKYGDVKAIKILKEHGYIEEVNWVRGYSYSIFRQKFPNSKVTEYLENNPLIKRKSVGLDQYKFDEIPKPELEKVGLFHKKEIIKRNEIKIDDYNDRIRAQKEYRKNIANKF